MNIDNILTKQRQLFNSGATLGYKYRLQNLKNLKESILFYENEIYRALENDLGKHIFESYMTEVHMVLSEINLHIRNLKKWMKPKRVSGGILNFPSKALITPQPYGLTLIISPWNYPFQLLFSPLVGAVSAGNCAILKPSEISKHTTDITEKIIKRAFKSDYIAVIQGEKEVTQSLLNRHWDYIFFTGSTEVGKVVARSAAEYLTPHTLELGGKSPTIIDKNANLKLAAKRIAWGKLINAGQTCVAPDYVLIHRDIKDKFIELFISYTRDFYLNKEHFHFCKIINERHYNRIENLLEDQDIIKVWDNNSNDLVISPTIIDNPRIDSRVMQEEIFGPVLPVLSYNEESEILERIKGFGKPLALYIFSNNKKFINKILENTSSGGVCINDTISHLIPHNLPFGGVQESGNGSYHGYESFKSFSHLRSILKKGNLDPAVKFPPYIKRKKWINILKRLV